MIYLFNNIEIETDNFSLLIDNKETSVEPQVFNLIVLLIENKDKVVTRDFILDKIWKDRVVSDTSINNYIKSARKVLGDDGSKQQVIKTIHSRGYQFVAELTNTKKPSNTIVKGSKNHSYINLAIIIFITTMVVSMSFFLLEKSNQSKSQDSPYNKMAVMPFLNSKVDSQTDYIGFALADQIIGALNYFENVSVRPSSSVRQYANQVYNLSDVSVELDVRYILSGHYLIINDDIRLNIELIDMNTNEIIWRGKPIQTKYNNTFSLQDMAVRQVVHGLKIKFSSKKQNRIQKDIPSNPLAYEYYLRSIAYSYNTEGHRLAIEMLKQSLALDNQFAPSYIQLGNRIRRLAQYGLVDDELSLNTEYYYLKALELNPDLLDAMAYLSMYYTESNRIDDAMALARYMQQLNPNNANTHFTLGYIYRYSGMLDEAIDEMEKAVILDSKNIKFRSIIGTYSAIGEYQKALDMTKNYEKSPFTYGWQALMNMRLGNTKKALKLYDYIIINHPNSLWSNVSIIHKSYLLGNTEAGLEAVSSLVNTRVNDGETIYYTAAYYGLLGEKNLSIQLLRKAINAGYFNVRNIESNDYFNEFKDSPEFQVVLNEARIRHNAFREKFFSDK